MGNSSNLVPEIPASWTEFFIRGATESTSQQRMVSLTEVCGKSQGNGEGVNHHVERWKVLSLEMATRQQS